MSLCAKLTSSASVCCAQGVERDDQKGRRNICYVLGESLGEAGEQGSRGDEEQNSGMAMASTK